MGESIAIRARKAKNGRATGNLITERTMSLRIQRRVKVDHQPEKRGPGDARKRKRDL